jgi:DNA polymerase III delta subunit
MLYVFHGSDTHTTLTKATSLVASLRAKKPDASYVRVEAGQWTPSIIEEHLGGQGLFSNKYIIFLDRVTENAEAKEQLPEFIEALKESSNIFILLETKLNAELKKAVEKYAEKVVECGKEDKVGAGAGGSFGNGAAGSFGKSDDFNVFALADALGSRDRFKAWSLFRQAIDAGVQPENISGTLFWQMKSMMLAREAKSAGEAGVSPFVFTKAKKHAGNYSKEELQNLATSLITIYHEGHRGRGDIELGLERMMLSL